MEVSWKIVDGELIMGFAVLGDSSLQGISSNPCRRMRFVCWNFAMIFAVGTEIAHQGYRVGLLLTLSDARLNTEVTHAESFGIPIGPENCEVFITDAKGERSLPFRKISVISASQYDISTPLF